MKKVSFALLFFISVCFICFTAPVFAAALSEKESNDSKSTATAFSLGQEIAGIISGNLDAEGGSKDVDWYQFKVEHNGTCVFRFAPIESAEQNDIKDGWEVELFDFNRNLLREYLYAKTSLRSGAIALKPGTYFIRVKPSNAYTWLPLCKYKLRVDFSENADWIVDSFDNATSKTIAMNRKYYGSLYSGTDTDMFICPLSDTENANVSFSIHENVVQNNIKDGWNVQIFDGNRSLIKECSTMANLTIPDIKTDTGKIRILVSTPSSSDYYAPIDCPYSITVTAKTIPVTKHIVTFTDSLTGNILESKEVKSGYSATPPKHPVHEGYNFLKWNKDTSYITGDLTVKALYAKKKFTVEFIDGIDDTTLKTQIVKYGDSAVAPKPKKHTGYDFRKWKKDFNYVKSNLTVRALYTKKKYTVKFVDSLNNDKVISRQIVRFGNAASEPVCPEHEGYRFYKWSLPFSKITSNKTISAVYKSSIILVKAVKIQGKRSVRIRRGETYQIDAFVVPQNAADTNLKYKSSNKKVATVSKTGEIKARKKGKCVITVYSVDGNKKAQLKVRVK